MEREKVYITLLKAARDMDALSKWLLDVEPALLENAPSDASDFVSMSS